MRSRSRYTPVLLVALAGGRIFAQGKSADQDDSALEQLTKTKILVSSVSRKEEDLDAAPAAVFVLSREDIARSSASNIPDLLRIVPGLQVAQLTASTWAVSARGFNSAFANKLLVLIDGRTVYSEIYSGAHWDEIDMPLENVERIEIIRGPGAAVWGANAANGVINIITRPARSLQGTLISSQFSRADGRVLLQHGGPLGDRAQYRIFTSYADRRPLENLQGQQAFDGQSLVRSGGRIDYKHSQANSFSLLGDFYKGHLRQTVNPYVSLASANGGQEHDSLHGGFLEGGWIYDTPHSSTNLQTYYVDDTRHELSSEAKTRTFDVDAVSHLKASQKVDLVWGGEVRYTNDHSFGTTVITSMPISNNYLASGFLQADVALKPKVLIATVGTKLQTGTLSGGQVQPSIRFIWFPDNRDSVWIAASRAVVVPSLQDKNIVLPLHLGENQGIPIVGTLLGNPDFRPEEVEATELGYRRNFGHGLSFDLATYVNKTLRLQALSAGTPTFVLQPAPSISISELYVNGFSALSAGTESSLTWRPFQSLQTQASYSWTEAHLTQKLQGSVSLVDDYSTARNTFAGNLFWKFQKSWSMNGLVYRVGRVPGASDSATVASQTLGQNGIPGYTRLDVNVKRTVHSNLAFQAGGTNLLQARHLEFNGSTGFQVPLYVPRSVFVRAAWSF